MKKLISEQPIIIKVLYKKCFKKECVYAGANSGIPMLLTLKLAQKNGALFHPSLLGYFLNNESDLSEKLTVKKVGAMQFCVDGSPVVHDVFIRGIDEEGNIEDQKIGILFYLFHMEEEELDFLF